MSIEKIVYRDISQLFKVKGFWIRDDVEFYFKLPFWFKIKTPIGNYNPDWALIKKNENTVYFVAETKSAGQELKTSEKRKIKCGYAHFKEFDDVKYRQVATVAELDWFPLYPFKCVNSE